MTYSMVCVLDTWVCCAIMGELIEMSFLGLTRVSPMNHVLDVVQIPQWKGAMSGCPAYCEVPLNVGCGCHSKLSDDWL